MNLRGKYCFGALICSKGYVAVRKDVAWWFKREEEVKFEDYCIEVVRAK